MESLSHLFYKEYIDSLKEKFPITINKLYSAPESLYNHARLYSNGRNEDQIKNNCDVGFTAEKLLIECHSDLILNSNDITDYKFTYGWDILSTKTGIKIEVKTYTSPMYSKNFINLKAESPKFTKLVPKYPWKYHNRAGAIVNIENALQENTADIIIFIYVEKMDGYYTYLPTLIVDANYFGVIHHLIKKSLIGLTPMDNKLKRCPPNMIDLSCLQIDKDMLEYKNYYQVLNKDFE